MKKLEEYVVSIPDFPEEGIIFRDVTSVLQDADGLQLAVNTMQDRVKDLEFDAIFIAIVNHKIRQEVEANLIQIGVPKEKIY